jgi:hypothetical protein
LYALLTFYIYFMYMLLPCFLSHTL